MATPHKELVLKLGLKKFGGQILKWQEFWDTFNDTILKITLLQPVEKFSSFKSRIEKQIFGINHMVQTYKCKLWSTCKYAEREIWQQTTDCSLVLNTIFIPLENLWYYQTASKTFKCLRWRYLLNRRRQMISTIQSKLWKVVLVQLEGRIDGGKNWTVDMLNKSLKNCITTQKLHYHSRNCREYINGSFIETKNNKELSTKPIKSEAT